MNFLIVDFRKLLVKDVKDFTRIDHSIFNFESLKRLLHILSKRRAEVYFMNFPDNADFYHLVLFWIDNCYPGRIAGVVDRVEELRDTGIDDEREPIAKESDSVWTIVSYGDPTPITDDDAKLAIYYHTS